MVVQVSFTKRLPPAAVNRGTLAELMAKQKSAALLKSQISENMQSPTIMQGLGNMAHIGLAAFKEGRAERDLGIQQERQRALVKQIDPATGATSDQLAQMGEFDPELMMELWKDRASKMREDARHAEELKIKEFEYQRDIKRDDFKYDRDIKRDDFVDTREAGQEAGINEREKKEADAILQAEIIRKAQEQKDQWSHEADIDTRETKQEVITNARELREAREKEDRDLKAKGVIHITGDQAKAQGLDPNRQWEFNPTDHTSKDITAKPEEVWRDATDEDYAKNPRLDPIIPYRISNTGRTEAIGTPQQGQAVSSEVKSRIGMMTRYLTDYHKMVKEVEGGALQGTGYVQGVQLRMGRPAEIYSSMQSGADALLRNLTGAGMPQQEAERYVSRYEPTLLDAGPGGADRLARKMRDLFEDMKNTRQGALNGARWDEILPPEVLANENPYGDPEKPAPTDAAGGGRDISEMSDDEVDALVAQQEAAADAARAAGPGGPAAAALGIAFGADPEGAKKGARRGLGASYSGGGR